MTFTVTPVVAERKLSQFAALQRFVDNSFRKIIVFDTVLPNGIWFDLKNIKKI